MLVLQIISFQFLIANIENITEFIIAVAFLLEAINKLLKETNTTKDKRKRHKRKRHKKTTTPLHKVKR